MPINFPDTPHAGDTYTSAGISWVYDGTKWNAGGVASAFVPLTGSTMSGPLILSGDPTVPLGAVTKQYSDTKLALAGGTMTGGINGVAPPAGDNSSRVPTTAWVNANRLQNRNRIINGNFLVDQFNSYGAVTPTATAYVCDRWQLGMQQASKLTAQSAVVGIAGAWRAERIAVASAYAPAVGETFYLRQAFEYINVADLQGGTANAATATLSFWVISSIAGMFGGSLQGNQASGAPASYRSYPFTYTLAANVWTQVVLVIPLDTATWTAAASNAVGMLLFFDLGSGATFRASTGGWVSGNFVGANGAVNLVANAGATFYLTDVQLELGSQASPFDFMTYPQQLALCQRYYETGLNQMCSFAGTSTSGSTAYWSGQFRVPKRVTPTMAYQIVGVNMFPNQAPTAWTATPLMYGVNMAANAAGVTPYYYFNWQANAEL